MDSQRVTVTLYGYDGVGGRKEKWERVARDNTGAGNLND